MMTDLRFSTVHASAVNLQAAKNAGAQGGGLPDFGSSEAYQSFKR
jgi:hypothetical protein